MTNPNPASKRRRRWMVLLAVMVIGPAVALIALPWALSTEPARRWLLAKANRAMKPGSFELDSLRFSWFGPTRMSNFVIRDAQGDRVVAAPRATWDRNFRQVLFERPNLGTLTLDRAAIDAERRADGSIDLYEALKPVIGLNPDTDLKVIVNRGSLHFRAEGQPVPVTADEVALVLEIHADPGPITWQLKLSKTESPGPSRLEIAGTYERRKDARPSGGRSATGSDDHLAIQVTGDHWPWSIVADGVSGSGRLDGNFAVDHREGRWTTSGKVAIVGLDATGPRLEGDHPRLDRVAATWDLARSEHVWTVNRIDVESPVGTLLAGETDSVKTVDGTLDLAALARLVPHSLRIREGTSIDRGRATIQAHLGKRNWRVEAEVSDLSGRGEGRSFTIDEPVKLSARIERPDGMDRLNLSALALSSPYGTLNASGSLDDPHGRREVELRGTIGPDWNAINRWLADRVEPGARIAGGSCPWRVRGSLAGGSASEMLKALDGRIGFSLAADVYGMHVGPSMIVVRAKEGRIVVDPIETTLNEGRLHLEPTFTFGDNQHGPTIRLGPESTIVDARINDEVSRRVLSFVAPILENASRVRGRVSVDLDEAVFPIGGDARHGTTVDGEVRFQDVEFIAGPLGDQLLGLIGRDDLRDLKLDQPITLSIADRKVYQEGLALPLGKISRIELEGWVDFDRNMALTATLPVTPAMFGNRPILGDIVEGTAITVPIRGTLNKPEIDRDAMKHSLADLGKTLLQRTAVRGAAELLMRLGRPRDPNAPPPLTPEERRERRKERQDQRRRNRGLDP